MVGGAAYAAGKRGQRSAYREDDEEQRLQQLESSQQAPAAAAPAPAAAAAGPSTDMVGRLKELAALKDSGALTPEEFDAAKAKVLAG
jgi:TolA-binding protein